MRDIVVGGSGLVVGGVLGSGVVIGLEAVVAGAVGLTLLLVSPAAPPAPVPDAPMQQAQVPAAPVVEAVPAAPVAPVAQDEDFAAAEAAHLRAARQMEQEVARAEAEMARAEAELDRANGLIEGHLEALAEGEVKKVNLAPLGLPVDVPIPKLGLGKRKGRGRK